MKLENQVTSLELSQKLKELGVKQESYFYWYGGKVLRGNQLTAELRRHEPPIPAYSVAELGTMLPRQLCDADQKLAKEKGKCYSLVETFLYDDYCDSTKINGFQLKYGDSDVKVQSESALNSAGIYYIGSEADTRAKMLIYLLDNKLITL